MDSMQDIKQYLADAAETTRKYYNTMLSDLILLLPSDVTCYQLTLNKKKVNEFAELSQLGDLGANPVFEMVESPYDDFQVKIHLRKLQGTIKRS